MFICGRRRSGDEDGDKNERHMRTKRSKKSIKKNPYAERGMEKFHRLLADLEEERQKIYRQNRVEAEDISLVRFVYSDSFKHVKPIVVRAKNSTTTSPAAVEKEIGDGRREENGRAEEKKEMCLGLGVMMVLVLVFIAIYGRSFALPLRGICFLLAFWGV